MDTNKSWFSSVDNCVLLGDFLTRQPQLQELRMRDNYFCSEATDEFLLQLSQAPALKTIQTIYLPCTGNFSSGVACEALGNIIASAPALKLCDIDNQQRDREVKVEVTNATAGPDEEVTDENCGTVVVKDKATGDTIYSVTTPNRQITKVEFWQ